MLIALTFAAAIAGQTAPSAPPPPAGRSEVRRDVRVVTVGGPDDGRGGSPDMDRNGDGFVTREEFTAPQAAAFDMLDANRDGRISTEEFAAGRAAAHVILGGPGGPGGPGGVRIRMDGPGGPGPMGDGEVMMFRRGGSDGPEGPGVRIHTFDGPDGPGEHDGPGDLDLDHDGKISEAEFLAPLREAFQHMDADHSGSLDAGEHGAGGRNVVIVRRDGPGGE
ncbi:hypothetical protein BH09PSE1_BH09PSE1_07900 [soil metagenome]